MAIGLWADYQVRNPRVQVHHFVIGSSNAMRVDRGRVHLVTTLRGAGPGDGPAGSARDQVRPDRTRQDLSYRLARIGGSRHWNGAVICGGHRDPKLTLLGWWSTTCN